MVPPAASCCVVQDCEARIERPAPALGFSFGQRFALAGETLAATLSDPSETRLVFFRQSANGWLTEGFAPVVAGDTLHFQLWYRGQNGGATTNLSSAIRAAHRANLSMCDKPKVQPPLTRSGPGRNGMLAGR
ncbi:MAG: hypothetical protein ACJA2W_000979 [Planctomycetota bacterium]|jgi:hypothetical protein